MRLAHSVTYQGLPCVAVSFGISEGLYPDHGWVEMDYRHLGQVKLFPKQILVRAVNGVAYPVGITPAMYVNNSLTGTAGPSVTTPVGGEGGLVPFADLVLKTAGGDGVENQVRFRDVYIDPAGVQEVTEGIVKGDEPRGIVRVRLVDVRHFYTGRNPCFFRVNCKLPSGAWDHISLNEGELWPMTTIVRFVFSQLPGSPAVMAIDAGLPPPGPIIANGESALEVLDALLKREGLVALKQRDNNYVVRRRGAEVDDLQIATGPNQWRAIGGADKMHQFKKSGYLNYRPMAVSVLGESRVARKTSPCVPVVKNEKGRWERLEAFVERIGYTMDALNAQVMKTGDAAFWDIANLSIEGEKPVLARILREQAYKCYAPALLFGPRPSTPDAPSDGQPITELSDADFENCQFLPVVSAPHYVSELAEMDGVRLPPDSEQHQGDDGPYVLFRPIVWGWAKGHTINANMEQVQERFTELLASANRCRDEAERKATEEKREGDRIGYALDELQKLRDRLHGEGLAASDFQTIGLSPGATYTPQQIENALNKTHAGLRSAEAQNNLAIENLEEQQTRAVEVATRLQSYRELVVSRYEAIYTDRVLKCVMQYAYGVCKPHVASNGIITFSDRAFLMRDFLVLNPDDTIAVGDGMVRMVWGYERKGGNISDRMIVTFGAEDQEENAQVHVIGVSFPVAPMQNIVHLPTMRSFEDEAGKPMNLEDCIQQARRAVGEVFNQPREATGFEYEFDSFVGAELEAGFQSIQHEWIGKRGVAKTHAFANCPGGIGPISQARRAKGPA